MHIVIGLIAGIVLGAVAGSAAVQLTAPAVLTVPSNRPPDVPAPQAWDI